VIIGIQVGGAHRAAAARARRLLAEAATRWLKEQLADKVARHEQIAEEIDRASELGPDAEPAQAQSGGIRSETPGG